MPLNEPVLRVLGDILDAEKKLLTLKAEADEITGKPYLVTVLASADEVTAVFLDALEKYKVLQAAFDTDPLKIPVDDLGAQATFAKLAAEYTALGEIMNKGLTAKLSDAQVLDTAAAMAVLASKVENLRAGLHEIPPEIEVTATALGRLQEKLAAVTMTNGGSSGFWGLGSKLNLFGGSELTGAPGLLSEVAGWHLALDAGVEILAVWVPALVALGVASAVAAPDINAMYKQLSDVNVIAQATGQKFGAVNGAVSGAVGPFQKLQNQMQPGLIELYGAALDGLTGKSDILGKVVGSVEHTFDEWGAQMDIAAKGSSLGNFLLGGATDVEKLGDSFGDLFKMLSPVIHELPGTAQVLLAFGSGAMDAAGHVLAFLGPVLKVGLALHGFIIWGGLATTAMIMLYSRAILPLIKGVGNLGLKMTQLGFSGMASLVSGPMLAIAALAALAAALYAADRAATSFNTNLENKVAATPVLQALAALKSADSQSSSYFNSQTAKMMLPVTAGKAGTGIFDTGVDFSFSGLLGAFTGNDGGANFNAAEAGAGLTKLQQQTLNYQANLASLSRQFGSTANAESLMTSAGITTSQMIGKGSQNMAVMVQMMQNYEKGLQGMGQSTGMMGQDLAVMNKQQTDAYAAMQKLNQAWDQQTSDMTGSESAFDTYAQGLAQLDIHGQSVTLTLGKLTDKFTEQKSALDSLTPSGIALNQAFQSQVTNSNALFDTWRSAGLSANIFTSAVKNTIAMLVPTAAGSKTAVTELAGLAQEAGYSGPASLSRLTQWLGITKGSLKDVEKATEQATAQQALLSGAMQATGNMIASTLSSDLSAAALKYSGLKTAIGQVGQAQAQHGLGSPQYNAAMDTAIGKIYTYGQRMHSTLDQTLALASSVLHLPESKVIRILLNVLPTGSMEAYNLLTQLGVNGEAITHIHAPNGASAVPSATGRLVPPGFPNDSYLARLTSGEAVVPAHLTPAVAPFLRSHGVPGFASGFVPAGMNSYNGMGGGNGDTYNIGVQGDTNPDAAALRIIQTVRRYKSRHGNQSTGIG